MRASLLIVCAALALTGCGPDGPLPQDVRGTINYDGRALTNGKVYFVPSGGGPPVIAEVQAGAFELKALPGAYKVEVRMFRDRIPWPGEPHDKQINVVPSRFNSETTLTAEVRAGADNTFTFAAQSR